MFKSRIMYFSYEWKILFRKPVNLFFIFVYPMILLFMYGLFLRGSVPPQGFFLHNPYNGVLSRVLGTVLLVGSLLTWGQERGAEHSMRRYRIFQFTPFSRFFIDTVGAVVSVGALFLSTLVLMITSHYVYGTRFPQWGLYLPAFALSSITFYSLTLLIIAVTKVKSGARIELFLVFFVLLFFSGTTFPLEMFPDGARRIVGYLPSKHALALFESLLTSPSAGQGESLVKSVWPLLGHTALFQLLRWGKLRWSSGSRRG